MNSYYLHNGTESIGPFDLTELKAKSIVKTTPVWCAGMQDWKHAGDVAELQTLFIILPPPINGFSSISKPIEEREVLEEQQEVKSNSKIAGIDKTLFYILSVLLILIAGTVVFSAFEDNRSAELEQKNRITEKNNLQFQLQEKEIEAQKQRIIEQEKLEFERVLKERKVSLNSRLVEVQQKLFVAVSALNQAKDKLEKAKDFQFLRSDSERENDINLSQKEIDTFNNEIIELKKEMDHIYLELEKIKI